MSIVNAYNAAIQPALGDSSSLSSPSTFPLRSHLRFHLDHIPVLSMNGLLGVHVLCFMFHSTVLFSHYQMQILRSPYEAG